VAGRTATAVELRIRGMLGIITRHTTGGGGGDSG
jgi:hypothetical protein